MYTNKEILIEELKKIKRDGLYKNQRHIQSDQQTIINVNIAIVKFYQNIFIVLMMI